MSVPLVPSTSRQSSDQFDASISDELNTRISTVPAVKSLIDFPRIISGLQLLDESEDESIWCGPPSDLEDSGKSEIRALSEVSKIIMPCQTQQRRKAVQIRPRGSIDGDNQKFVYVFHIGLEDDDDKEFCLVKRIIGKEGCNMRRIAEESNAKVRLRGIGSGFLEGRDAQECNCPLQLNISCSCFEAYQGAVERVSALLKDLYKHHRRYRRSKGRPIKNVQLTMEEQRRDDLGIDILRQKALRSPSQRERDRLDRKRERESLQKATTETDQRQSVVNEGLAWQVGLPLCDRGSENPISHATGELTTFVPQRRHHVLLDSASIPTTPQVRRIFAKAGGAEYGAIMSAAARSEHVVARNLERARLKQERKETKEKERGLRSARAMAFVGHAKRIDWYP